MNIMQEGVHAEEGVLSEANGYRSRETITLKSGRAYQVGDVLGKASSGGDAGKYKLVDKQTPATDGSQTAVAILLRAVDATFADAPGVILARDAEYVSDLLNYAPNTTYENKALAHIDLAAVGIIVRNPFTLNASAPDIFESDDWSIAAGVLSAVVTIISPPHNGGSPITDIEYRIASGDWVSSEGTTGFTISDMTAGATTVAIRARNAVGVGPASATKNVTPTAD